MLTSFMQQTPLTTTPRRHVMAVVVVVLVMSVAVLQTAEAWYVIDSERFEQMDVKCRLLPAKLQFFTADSFTVPLNNIAPVHR